MTAKKICLIDGSGYIFRAFYGLPEAPAAPEAPAPSDVVQAAPAAADVPEAPEVVSARPVMPVIQFRMD